MLIKGIILFTLFVSFFICGSDQLSTTKEKHRTTSRTFQKLRTNSTKHCQYINNNFDKLKGIWYYVLRTATPNTPMIRCGHLTVVATLEQGFESRLRYLTHEEEVIEHLVVGIIVNETVLNIPQLDEIVTGNPEWKYPFHVQMGLCDNDTIFFIEPIHYLGGGMVFTREMPANVNVLRLRFGTYDEESGKERTDRVGSDCNISRFRNPSH